jgi:hypothetical protein
LYFGPAAGLDPRPLEENRIPLKQIGRHAQNRLVRITLRDGASASGRPSSCAAAAAGAEPNAPHKRQRRKISFRHGPSPSHRSP